MFRPQPLGIFPFPTGSFILPDCPEAAGFAQFLLQGKIPPETPDRLRFYSLALAGDFQGAFELLEQDVSIEGQFNHFVLQPTAELYAGLKRVLPVEFLTLLDDVAYSTGLISMPLNAPQLDGELLGFSYLIQATSQVEAGDIGAASSLLTFGINEAESVSPVLAAQLRNSLAEMKLQIEGPTDEVLQLYTQALSVFEKTDLAEAQAGVHLNLGICLQDRSQGNRAVLVETVKHYQSALRFFTFDAFPEAFALAQNNLALAYLAMPMQEASDQLRMGVAIQALREVLKVYTRATHPERWASAQLNLANALQYLPSTHTQENLIEAVNLYEEIVSVRRAETDPLGFARLLANQGNCLAHLGIFDHASQKLQAARDLFATNGEPESAATVSELLAEIDAHQPSPLKVEATVG